MMDQDMGSFNIGIRFVRNAAPGSGSVEGAGGQDGNGANGSSVLIAYFSWGGNTRGIAQEIQNQTGADLFEITLVEPYSSDYHPVLDEARRDQNEQARPELASHVENMEDYDTIILGFPVWWYTAPAIIRSFLEAYDFSGKVIVPFATSGGSGLGRTEETLQELVPAAVVKDGRLLNGRIYTEELKKWADSFEN